MLHIHDVGFGAGPTAHGFVSDIDGNKQDKQLENGTGCSNSPSLTQHKPARARVPHSTPPARSPHDTCRRDMVNTGV